MSAPDEKVQDLKMQLNQIQSEIDRVEKVDPQEKEVKDLMSWSSPSRVFRKRDKSWFTNVSILVLVLIVIILFVREFIPISVVLAIAFVYYVLATVPPDDVEHKITTQGITSSHHSYLWNELVDFWFTAKHDQKVLNVGTKLRYPGRLIMLLGSEDLEKVKDTLVNYLPFREVPKVSWLDKIADALSKKLPSSIR